MWLIFPDAKLNSNGYGIGKKYGGFMSCRGKFAKTSDGYVPDGKVTLRFNFNRPFFLGGDREQKSELPSNRFLMYQLKNITRIPFCESFDLPPFTFHRSVGACVFLNDYIYLIGGFDGNRSISHVERFSILSGKWEICSRLAQRRSSLSGITFGGKILVFGGLQCNHCFSAIESYDPDRNAWTHCGELKYGRSGASVIEINGKVYIFGGLSNELLSPPLEIYDITRNQTEEHPNIRVNRSSFGMVKFKLKEEWYIFLAAGTDNRNQPLKKCLLYNVAKNRMEPIPPLKYARKYPNAVFQKDKIYVYGGHNGRSVVSVCEIYYVKKKKWHCLQINFPYCGCNTFLPPNDSLVEFKAEYRKGILEGEVFKNKKYYGMYQNRQKHGRFVDCVSNEETFFYHGRFCNQQTFHQLENLTNVPKMFECPISLQLMMNPYVTSCGQTYEKTYIEEWMQNNDIDPCTRQSLQREIYPNHTLQQIIINFLNERDIYVS